MNSVEERSNAVFQQISRDPNYDPFHINSNLQGIMKDKTLSDAQKWELAGPELLAIQRLLKFSQLPGETNATRIANNPWMRKADTFFRNLPFKLGDLYATALAYEDSRLINGTPDSNPLYWVNQQIQAVSNSAVSSVEAIENQQRTFYNPGENFHMSEHFDRINFGDEFLKDGNHISGPNQRIVGTKKPEGPIIINYRQPPRDFGVKPPVEDTNFQHIRTDSGVPLSNMNFISAHDIHGSDLHPDNHQTHGTTGSTPSETSLGSKVPASAIY